MAEKLNGFEFWENTLNSAKLVVAPMVDASELAWRMLSRRHGAQLCYTPMYHAAVFARDPQYRTEALRSCTEDRPLIVQFCANDPQVLLDAALLAEGHCDAIDLNLGCPQQIARRGHYGAYLQEEWDLLHDMVSLCHKRLKVPITCKIRVFEDVDKTIKYAQMLEKAGCQLLTVHGRTREQKGMETGLANWQYIKAVKDSVSIPVFANGNIQYKADVERCIQATGVNGVMVAEGNLHNPCLFTGEERVVWDMAQEYIALVETYPCSLSYIRGHLFKICHHAFSQHPVVREKLAVSRSVAAMKDTIFTLQAVCQDDVARHKADPSIEEWDLPLPYWICQPYVRPTQEQRDAQAKHRETLKRHLKAEAENIKDKISKNKQKKLKRYPNKNPNEKKLSERAAKYAPCVNCSNCKGFKCTFSLCKKCCIMKTHKDIVDCAGHNLLVKTKQERRAKWEADQKTRDFQLPYASTNGIEDKTKQSCEENMAHDGTESNVQEVIKDASQPGYKHDKDSSRVSDNDDTTGIVKGTSEIKQENENLGAIPTCDNAGILVTKEDGMEK